MKIFSPNDVFQSSLIIKEIFAKNENLETLRSELLKKINTLQYEIFMDGSTSLHVLDKIIVRDCARAWRSMLNPRSEKIAGHSILEIMFRAFKGENTTGYNSAFWAEIVHLVRGVEGQIQIHDETEKDKCGAILSGREMALWRSEKLNEIGAYIGRYISRYESGLGQDAINRRKQRRRKILSALSGKTTDWNNWKWHVRNIAKNAESLARIAPLSEDDVRNISNAVQSCIPFGVTPYYASLFDDNTAEGRDRSIRAQVIPPERYVESFHETEKDFMLETDTSPEDRITRRYPSIVIFKPYNSCPQICVYCQRNWEIKSPMFPGAMAKREELERAFRWLEENDAISEVIVTGGDPLVMTDSTLKKILDRLSSIEHIKIIRIGTRTPVTLPMRFTSALCRMLASYIVPGKRMLCLMTHVQHPYEVTPEFVRAIHLLKRNGISVYNQLVYTFYVSRRFEAAALRKLLRECGVDPYYTFYPKGKEETIDYRVPVARLLQEQKEEARLLSGLCRTDEAVFNLPGIGKNYLNAWQHRDLISIARDGSRIYEFHPWEKKIVPQKTYIAKDVPIYEYLKRLESLGEDVNEYANIWFYF